MTQSIYDIVPDFDALEINIFGIRIHPLSRAQFLQIIRRGIEQGEQITQFGVNSATVNDVVRNSGYLRMINSADLIHIDGMSVVWTLRSFGYDIPERVATPDLAEDVLKLADINMMSLFLFGAKESTLLLCKENIEKRYPNIRIAGVRNGYYTADEEKDIFTMINNARPDILMLGMSSPKKELFIENYRHLLNARYILGVGGYFDIVSGMIKRAPLWMQKRGLEWVFRLIQEPRRLWKRYLIGIFRFEWLVCREKLRRSGKRRRKNVD